ncbi:MAG: proline--tRNA ligase, partial [Candidatus Competibacteraceae bacterium]|nr:proline--tRNA ligase [Candidatus Competibacteraceae bacterium]
STGDYAANVELAEALAPQGRRLDPAENLTTVATPGVHTIAELAAFLEVSPERCLKTLLVKGSEDEVVALCLRGDHELNPLKAEKLPQVASPLTFASEAEVRTAAGCGPGSLGPLGLDVPVIADRAAAHLADFVCGANQEDRHLGGVNWARDLPEPQVADLRNVVAGDPSPDGRGTLAIARGIEVGHIFQLGDKYSRALQATVLDEQGRDRTPVMGCYGIGVSRVVAAAIEQHHDQRGILWPNPMAPFQVALLPINAQKSQRLREAAESLYRELQVAGFEVLLDDRGARPGVMFADMELIGIPHRVVLSEKHLDAGQVEYKGRRDRDSTPVERERLLEWLRSRQG